MILLMMQIPPGLVLWCFYAAAICIPRPIQIHYCHVRCWSDKFTTGCPRHNVVVFAGHYILLMIRSKCLTLLLEVTIFWQPSDTLLDYSFFPVHMMMARHIGVQCAYRAFSFV